MVFSSFEFVFVFFPLSVVLYYALLRTGFFRCISPYIFFISLIYYSWWDLNNLYIIITSILFNYYIGKRFSNSNKYKKICLTLGITGNLAALGIYKYTDFIIQTINNICGSQIPLQQIILPLGISFFTFQQIAWLVDNYRGDYQGGKETFWDYCCFVCFFPQLIAGPIVHHHEMMPQFFNTKNYTVNWENIFNGIVLFSLGLSKKVLLADTFAFIAQYAFDSAPSLSFMDALIGALAWTLQVYFDFSGYSDMAIGGALFFNIHLPWNFDSPYKACNIEDFWRRWHMTLSRWLRDYLYIPLGGNRYGKSRMHLNLFITFVLCGLWHGAGWNYVIFGLLHGIAVIIHRIWSEYLHFRMPRSISWTLTFAFYVGTLIVFRSSDFTRIKIFMEAFGGTNGWMYTSAFRSAVSTPIGITFAKTLQLLGISFVIALFCPNSKELLAKSPRMRIAISMPLFFCSLLFVLFPDQMPEFIYYQF